MTQAEFNVYMDKKFDELVNRICPKEKNKKLSKKSNKNKTN